MISTQVCEKRKIAVTIGIDLAKDHCDVVAYNADNKICFTKANMAYPKLMEWLANTQPAVVLMEACKGSPLMASSPQAESLAPQHSLHGRCAFCCVHSGLSGPSSTRSGRPPRRHSL